MSKLVEKVVVKQLMQHINKNNLDNPRQSAYKSGHSTKTTMHLSNWICLLHSTQFVLIVLSHGN